MIVRAVIVLLAFGLVILMGPTPYPVQFAGALQAARTALRSGRPDLALPPLEQALAREPGLADISMDMIEVALGAGEFDLALGLMQALPTTPRNSDQITCYRAQVAVESGDWQAGVDGLEAAGRPCDRALDQLSRLADRQIGAGEFDEARELLSQLLMVDRGNPTHHYRLGMLEAVRQPGLALSHLSLAEEVDPDLRLPEALREALQTGQESADQAYALAQVGQYMARTGNWALAAQAFDNALALQPEYTEARAYLGLALDRSGGDGLEALEQAVSEAPQAALPHQLLGQHWRQLGEPVLALKEFETAASLAADNPLIVADLGAAYAAVGDLPAARSAYLRATGLSPNDPMVWLLLAQFSVDFEVELLGIGIPAARRAVALRPDSANAWDVLGYGYFLAGRWELANRFLARALAIDPRWAAAHYHLGLLQIGRGLAGAGKTALEQAFSLDPEGRIGNLALRSLENLP